MFTQSATLTILATIVKKHVAIVLTEAVTMRLERVLRDVPQDMIFIKTKAANKVKRIVYSTK